MARNTKPAPTKALAVRPGNRPVTAGAGKSLAAAASIDTAGRPYATYSDELSRPYIPGESAAERRKAAQGWQWITLAALAVIAIIGYTVIWPAVASVLYRPSPLRNYLLPPSADPIATVAGVGVGSFWLLFIAAPLAITAFAGIWWAMLAMSNHRARRGHLGHTRPGQQWAGETYPTIPLILAATAVLLVAAGVLLRWAGPAATVLLGRLLLVAVLGVGGWAYVQFVRWAYARGKITRQINVITYLLSPALNWPDLRAGRVRAVTCCYPRGEDAYPAKVKLFYGQHPRNIGDELIAEVTTVLLDTTGHTYTLEHQPLTRTLLATESQVVEADPIGGAEAVLAPLVAFWFDTTATIPSIVMNDPPLVIDEDGNPVVGTDVDVPDPDQAQRAATTEADRIAERIKEFTVEFMLNTKVSNGYRRGVIEGMVADSLGGSWEAEWSLPSRRARFVRYPGLPTMVSPPLEFPEVTRANIRKLFKNAKIPFAVDAYGNHIYWDFTQSPHFLISGATSTGKTSLLMTVGKQCARLGMNVVWIDPKAVDSQGLHDNPNFSLVTAGFDDDGMVGHASALRYIADTMRDRMEQVKINPNRAQDFDPIIVVTDEFANLVMELKRFFLRFKNSSVDKGAPPTEEDVNTILRTSRAVGIHMAIGIQRPDTKFIEGEARDNTSLRVSMGRLRSKDAALMMFGDATAGTRIQPGIKGRGTVQLPDGTFREIQVFYTPTPPATPEQEAKLSDTDREVLAALNNVDSFWPRRVVNSALRGYDPEDPEQYAEMSFAAIRNSEIVKAADRPDLDQLSDQYIRPRTGERRPTMDDDHDEPDSLETGPPASENPAPVQGASFGQPVDGFADDYLPGIDDEYGPPVTIAANDLEKGDLVDLSVDGVTTWRYVHADPYVTDDDDGTERLVIPHRDLDDSCAVDDVDVDPYELLQARKLHIS